MSETASLREFLSSRRAAIDPQSVGLPPSSTRRRGTGLRREEVAALAGVSVDYYARLEQGRAGNVSDQVLSAVEGALGLDEWEREHFRALVGARPSRRRPARPARTPVRAGLHALLAAMEPIPAILQSRRLDVLAWNESAKVLLTDFGAMHPDQRNIARWLFLDPGARVRYPQWEEVSAPTVAALRAAYDPHVSDPALERLVGELSMASVEFARFWSTYRLFKHGHGTKQIFHEEVGTMTVNYETLEVGRSDGQFISMYTADVGSASDEKLQLLLSWKADHAGHAEELDPDASGRS